MASSLDLLHTISSFYDATSLDVTSIIYFVHAGFSTGVTIKFTGMTPSASASKSSRILPNGSKYDPYQTYAGPQTPGELVIEVAWVPNWERINAGAFTRNQTETTIQGLYYESMYMLNRRGELTGANASSDVTTATARLIDVSIRWGMPKQIPTILGGTGQANRGIEYARVSYKFDMLTEWSWS